MQLLPVQETPDKLPELPEHIKKMDADIKRMNAESAARLAAFKSQDEKPLDLPFAELENVLNWHTDVENFLRRSFDGLEQITRRLSDWNKDYHLKNDNRVASELAERARLRGTRAEHALRSFRAVLDDLADFQKGSPAQIYYNTVAGNNKQWDFSLDFTAKENALRAENTRWRGWRILDGAALFKLLQIFPQLELYGDGGNCAPANLRYVTEKEFCGLKAQGLVKVAMSHAYILKDFRGRKYTGGHAPGWVDLTLATDGTGYGQKIDGGKLVFYAFELCQHEWKSEQVEMHTRFHKCDKCKMSYTTDSSD